MPWAKPTTSSTARGYGTSHRKLRAQWERIIATGGVHCWRCHKPIYSWMDWELGHDDWNRDITRGPEHNACNRKAAAAKAKWIRTAGKRKRLNVHRW
jgi:hypothetical protein